MHPNHTHAELAGQAADAVQALNRQTVQAKVYTQPGDVSDVVTALTTLVQRLPQALQQAEAGLRALDERDAIRLDTGHGSQAELSDAVATALFGLTEARGFLERAHRQLADAAGPLSHMGGLWEDDDADAEA